MVIKVLKKQIFSILIILLINILFLMNVKADNKLTNVDCRYVRDSYTGAFPLTKETIVTLYRDGKKRDEEKVAIGGFTVKIHNNSKPHSLSSNASISSDAPYLRVHGSLISAVEYYNKYNSCPTYFMVDTTGGGNTYNGYFMNDTENVLGSYVLYKIEQKEYNENLELKDEIYSCNLYSSKDGYRDLETQVEINYTKKTILISNENQSERGKKAMLEYKKNFDFSDANKNKCPINELKVCSFEGNVNVYTKDYEDSALNNICATLDLTEKSEVGNTYCGIFVTYAEEVENGEDKVKINRTLDILNNYCSQVIQYEDYDISEFSCINMCLNKYKHIEGIKGTNEDGCGFSGRLIAFVANILKWIKYILPVGVMVFGILDFIKAIISNNEEMKKAQGRFVKRLIAAALVFIIPLIIEFILDKMGFGYDDCGLY